ncbi:MAG: hypothetical protein ABSH05_14570 [Bryobacteraceae bacterium]|jgi:hypothetical protein
MRVPATILWLFACLHASGSEMVSVVRFTKAPVPPCRTILVSFEKPDLSIFRGPVPASVVRDVRDLGAELQQRMAEALKKAGFEPRTDPASCSPCDLTIAFRVTRGEVRLRSIKAPVRIEYYAPAKLSIDFAYSRGASGELGTLRGKLDSPGKTELTTMANEVGAFTAAKIPHKE